MYHHNSNRPTRNCATAYLSTQVLYLTSDHICYIYTPTRTLHHHATQGIHEKLVHKSTLITQTTKISSQRNILFKSNLFSK